MLLQGKVLVFLVCNWRYLEGPKVGVHGEYVDELEGGEDVGGGEEALGDQGGVPPAGVQM